MVYVNTKEKIADIFTKPLPKDAFLYPRGKLGVIPLSEAHWMKFSDASTRESWRSNSWCIIVKGILQMNQYLRDIDIIRIVVFVLCCQRGRSLLSYLSEIFLLQKWRSSMKRCQRGRMNLVEDCCRHKVTNREHLVFKFSLCYDMLCCHQCQRGIFLDIID